MHKLRKLIINEKHIRVYVPVGDEKQAKHNIWIWSICLRRSHQHSLGYHDSNKVWKHIIHLRISILLKLNWGITVSFKVSTYLQKLPASPYVVLFSIEKWESDHRLCLGTRKWNVQKILRMKYSFTIIFACSQVTKSVMYKNDFEGKKKSTLMMMTWKHFNDGFDGNFRPLRKKKKHHPLSGTQIWNYGN